MEKAVQRTTTKPILHYAPEGLREITMPDSTMEPVINPGDRVHVNPEPIEKLKAGDLVVVMVDGVAAVRDVAEVDSETLTLRQISPQRTTVHPLQGFSEAVVVYSILRARAGAA
jgi:hypothetical protein